MSKVKYRFGNKARGYQSWNPITGVYRWKWLYLKPDKKRFRLWERRLIRKANAGVRKKGVFE